MPLKLIVRHPDHGLGAIEEVKARKYAVRFSSGRLFLVPAASVEILPATVLAGSLPRRDRTFVQRIQKDNRIQRGRFTLKRVEEPLRGLPGETVTERLVRKFFVGRVCNNPSLEREAFNTLVKLLRRYVPTGGNASTKQQWGRKRSWEKRGECPDYLAAYLLTLILRGDKSVTPRHFINRAKQLNIDFLRERGAEKRGEFLMHVDVDSHPGIEGHMAIDVASLDEAARVIRASWLKSIRLPSKSTRIHKSLEDHDGPSFFGK